MTQKRKPYRSDFHVAAAILNLQDQIKNSWLPTCLITEQYNKDLKKGFQLTVDTVGRACSRLGLQRKPTREKRGFMVTEEDLKALEIKLLQGPPQEPDDNGAFPWLGDGKPPEGSRRKEITLPEELLLIPTSMQPDDLDACRYFFSPFGGQKEFFRRPGETTDQLRTRIFEEVKGTDDSFFVGEKTVPR